MLLHGLMNRCKLVCSNVSSTRPTANFGTNIAVGASNVMGSYTEIISDTAVTQDIHLLEVNINSNYVAGTRYGFTDIGIDTSGGTSYSVVVPALPNTNAATYVAGGYTYIIPVFIPAGSAIAARAQVQNGTGGSHYVAIKGYNAPLLSEAGLVASKVVALGANLGTGLGAYVQQGTTSEGSWYSIGTPSQNALGFLPAITVSAAPQSDVTDLDVAVGDASNKLVVKEGVQMRHGELSNGGTGIVFPVFRSVGASETIYFRSQSSGSYLYYSGTAHLLIA